MMDSPAKVAEALKDLINAQSFSMPFTAVRSYAPFYRLEDLRELAVVVCPRLQEVEIASRGEDNDDITVDVWVQMQVRGKDATTDADAVSYLASQILKYLRRRKISSMPSLSYVSTKRLYVIPSELQTRNLFVSAISQTYREVVDV